ncbi:MAG: DUF4405 domain-containing protein [Desulforegulaceae bacterium]|nr:DUF4405 domain-containing protein [Desulforegulaceae bacterium]
MKQNKLKFFTDFTMYLLFSTLFFTGFLLYFVIPYGKGQNSFFLGLSRHGWKDIHFFFGLSFIIVLFFHLFLNLGTIKAMIKTQLKNKPLLIAALVLGFIPLTIFSLIIKLVI